MTLSTILLLFALVLTTLAAFNIPSSRVNLGWLGLASATLALLLWQRVAL